jgi:hypothetical protein
VTALRYPKQAIRADFVRAGAGIILTLGPLLAIPVATIAGMILSVLATIFIAFAIRTWSRQNLVVSIDEDGVTMTGLQRKFIAWRDITSLQLRYYAVKRDRSQGWMQLTIMDGDSKMQIESTLEDYERVVSMAARAAEQKGLMLSPSTMENIKALGLPTDNLLNGREAPTGPA